MVSLRRYSQSDQQQMVLWIADFYGFHSKLVGGTTQMQLEDLDSAKETLMNWCANSHELYCVELDDQTVGFLHIGYRGDLAAWIEDLYVDEAYRNQGIATQAIHLAEQIISSKPGYQAICFDVAPRNEAALKLYYKLGYHNLSLITLRKELGENKRDREERLLGYRFNI